MIGRTAGRAAAALSAAAMALLVACTAADQKPTTALSTGERIAVAGWSGGAFPRDGGPFARCVIRGRYKPIPALFFIIDNSFRLNFGVVSNEWSLEPFARYPVAYRIDDGPVHGTEGLATDGGKGSWLIFIGPIDVAAVGQFRTASSLGIAAAGLSYQFDLAGSAPAFDALLDCARHRGLQTAGLGPSEAGPTRGDSEPASAKDSKGPNGGTNPFERAADDGARHDRAESAPSNQGGGSNPFARPGAASPGKPRAGGGSGAEDRDAPGSRWQHTAPNAVAAARRFVVRLLAEAGVADVRILTGSDAPPSADYSDVVWRTGDQVGTLQIIEPRRYPSVVEASAAIVRDASLICGEGFTSAIAARKLRDGRPAAQMTVACARPTTFRADYTVVPVTGAGYYRINLTSFGDARAIDALHERIGLALPRVVPED